MAEIRRSTSPGQIAPRSKPFTFPPHIELFSTVEHVGLRLSAHLLATEELQLSFEIQNPPGVVAVICTLESYDKIADFRAMLAHPITSDGAHDYRGVHCSAYSTGTGPDLYYLNVGAGTTFCVAADQWQQIRELFHAAFALPEYSRAWVRLAAQKGRE